MIQRGEREHPHLDLRFVENDSLPFEERSFDAVILFGVLTCIPRDEDQASCLRKIRRLLRPGGILYASDFWIQKDERNVTRYRQYEKKHGTYGVFELPDGAVLRHHERRWISSLFAGLATLHLSDVVATTMNNHEAIAFQYLGRKENP
jgi:SAM-dependent methyltransferase